MRLVLVHGINQQRKIATELTDEWLNYLFFCEKMPKDEILRDTIMPFYGDLLASLTADASISAVRQGIGVGDNDEALFVAGALNEQAQAAGIGRQEIAREERAQGNVAVEQGFFMDRRINAIVQVLERASPLHGELAMRLLRQAYAYLKKPGVSGQIDAIVRPAIDSEPAIIVSHSLGTVVVFKILRQLMLEKRPAKIPLYVTLGSPLSLMAVQAALGPTFGVPEGVDRWVNAIDPNDFVGLGRGLDESNFCGGIENIVDINNASSDAHAIEGYLRDKRISRIIKEAFQC